MVYVAEAKRVASEVLLELDRVVDEEVGAFREAVQAAGLELMPGEEAPEIP
jgi:hypothetical protein